MLLGLWYRQPRPYLFYRKCSFTLIELLLVILLLGIVTGLAIPNLSQLYSNLQLKQTTVDISVLMRYAQSRAITQKRICRLNFDSQFSRYWITQATSNVDSEVLEGSFQRIKGRWGRLFSIPKHITIESGKESVEFYPDGRIEKIRVYLSYKKSHFTISTQEQMGRVRIFDFKII